jgi:hypothetical protein
MNELSKEIEKEIKDIIIAFDFNEVSAYRKISNMKEQISIEALKTIAFSILYDCAKSKTGFCICESNNLIAIKNVVKGKTQLTLRYYIEESKNY